jgi:hypothetical protein
MEAEQRSTMRSLVMLSKFGSPLRPAFKAFTELQGIFSGVHSCPIWLGYRPKMFLLIINLNQALGIQGMSFLENGHGGILEMVSKVLCRFP